MGHLSGFALILIPIPNCVPKWGWGFILTGTKLGMGEKVWIQSPENLPPAVSSSRIAFLTIQHDYMLRPALPNWGCELWFAGVQESIVKDEVNIAFRRKDYQLRYFFHNWSLPASKSIEQKSRLLENCIFRQETLSECPLFIMFLSLFCFIQNKGVRDCPRQAQGVRR